MVKYIEREAVIAKLDELCRKWHYTALMPLFIDAIDSLPYYVKGELEATLDTTDNEEATRELYRAKRLLKAAMEDMKTLYEAGKDEGCYGIEFRWRFADEAEKLLKEG